MGALDTLLDTRKMETDENSSGALGAGEHGGGSHQLQSPGSNPLGVGQGGNAAEGYVAKYAAKEDTKVNRSLSGWVMLNCPSLQSFPARDKKSIHDGGRGKRARRGARGGQTARREADERVLRER